MCVVAHSLVISVSQIKVWTACTFRGPDTQMQVKQGGPCIHLLQANSFHSQSLSLFSTLLCGTICNVEIHLHLKIQIQIWIYLTRNVILCSELCCAEPLIYIWKKFKLAGSGATDKMQKVHCGQSWSTVFVQSGQSVFLIIWLQYFCNGQIKARGSLWTFCPTFKTIRSALHYKKFCFKLLLNSPWIIQSI